MPRQEKRATATAEAVMPAAPAVLITDLPQLNLLEHLDSLKDVWALTATCRSLRALRTDTYLQATWLLKHRAPRSLLLALRATCPPCNAGAAASAKSCTPSTASRPCSSPSVLTGCCSPVGARGCCTCSVSSSSSKAAPRSSDQRMALLGHLIRLGADSNQAETDGAHVLNICLGTAPLHVASQMGNLPAVRLLLDAGAKIGTIDSLGATPLHLAAQYGHDGVVRQLLASGADVCAVDSRGHSPLHVAAEHGHAAVVNALIRVGGADVNLATSTAESGAGGRAQGEPAFRSCTPLHLACAHGHSKVAAVLLGAGARADAVDAQGHTPGFLAASKGHTSAIAAIAAAVAAAAKASEDEHAGWLG